MQTHRPLGPCGQALPDKKRTQQDLWSMQKRSRHVWQSAAILADPKATAPGLSHLQEHGNPNEKLPKESKTHSRTETVHVTQSCTGVFC